MNVVIIDYGAGNTKSVQYAFNRLGVEAVLSDDKEVIQTADKVIFPGVGHARFAMEELNNRGLSDVIKNLKQDTLGVCLGMQLMCNETEEGDVKGLGIFDSNVLRFGNELKVPQIGWNTVQLSENKLMAELKPEPYFYFVHSYYVPMNQYTIGKTDYGIPFSAAMNNANFYACQFHPEKSGNAGEQLLKNFLQL